MTKHIVAGAALLAALAAGPAAALERWVHVINDGQSAIWSVQISHIDELFDWGPDLLGRSVIPAGSYETVEPVRPQGYCRFDVKITYEWGQEIELGDVNLCEIISIAVSDSGYTRVSY